MIKKFDEFVKINENITNQKYLSDEDINKQYEGFEISDFTIKPRRRWYYQSGVDNPDTEYTWDISFNIIFPNAEHEDFDESLWENAFVYDEHGKRIGFDNWYPEDVAEKLIQMVRDEINKHWSELEKLKSDENHNMKSGIKESINYDQLNESFTNQELKDAIKAHGGLTVKHFYDDARTSLADFDLKNAKFVGYLKPETVDDIYNNNCYILLYKSRDIILRTNDGGIILVEKGNSVLDKNYDVWVRKVKTRNNNWIEDRVRKHPEEEYWNSSKVDIKYDSLKPEKHATYMRRSKHINRK